MFCVKISYNAWWLFPTLLAKIWYSYRQKQRTYWPHTDGRQSSLANSCSVEKWSYWRCFTIEVPEYIMAILNVAVSSEEPFLNCITWWRHHTDILSLLLAFVRGIHRSPVESPHKGQWLMFYLICTWKTVEQTIETQVIRDAIAPIMTSLWWKESKLSVNKL